MKKEAGFTLIELLIVISIMGFILIFGIANYAQYNRKKILEETAWNLMNNLRYAQTKALSGEKPSSGCGYLDGWRLSFSADGYELSAICDGDTVSVLDKNCNNDKNFCFPDGVSKVLGANNFLFKLLGHGVDITGGTGEIVLRFAGYSQDYKIIVSEMGEISNEGFQ